MTGGRPCSGGVDHDSGCRSIVKDACMCVRPLVHHLLSVILPRHIALAHSSISAATHVSHAALQILILALSDPSPAPHIHLTIFTSVQLFNCVSVISDFEANPVERNMRGQTDSQMMGRADGRTGERTGGQMDRWIDG
eukprot:322737-Chlamydomonas_euryale.AAC.5